MRVFLSDYTIGEVVSVEKGNVMIRYKLPELSRRGTRGYWRGRLVSACPGTRRYEKGKGCAVAVGLDVRRPVGDEEPGGKRSRRRGRVAQSPG